MKAYINVELAGTIKDLDKRQDLQLITDSQDVEAIKERFGNDQDLEDFGGFFIKIDNGDYDEVYGYEGTIPDLDKDIYKVIMEIK